MKHLFNENKAYVKEPFFYDLGKLNICFPYLKYTEK